MRKLIAFFLLVVVPLPALAGDGWSDIKPGSNPNGKRTAQVSPK